MGYEYLLRVPIVWIEGDVEVLFNSIRAENCINRTCFERTYVSLVFLTVHILAIYRSWIALLQEISQPISSINIQPRGVILLTDKNPFPSSQHNRHHSTQPSHQARGTQPPRRTRRHRRRVRRRRLCLRRAHARSRSVQSQIPCWGGLMRWRGMCLQTRRYGQVDLRGVMLERCGGSAGDGDCWEEGGVQAEGGDDDAVRVRGILDMGGGLGLSVWELGYGRCCGVQRVLVGFGDGGGVFWRKAYRSRSVLGFGVGVRFRGCAVGGGVAVCGVRDAELGAVLVVAGAVDDDL